MEIVQFVHKIMQLVYKLSKANGIKKVSKHFSQWNQKSLWNSGIANLDYVRYTNLNVEVEPIFQGG